MRRPPLWRSAALRIAVGVAALLMLFSLTAMALQYRAFRAELMAREEALLAAEAQALGALYQQRRIIALRQALEFRGRAAPDTGALYLLQDKAGRRLAGNLGGWPAGLTPAEGPPGAGTPERFAHAGAGYLGIGWTLPGGFPLLIARPLAATEAALAAARARIGGLAAAMAVGAALAGALAAALMTARVRRLNRLADAVAAGDLNARLPGPLPRDEFGQLAAHIHAMLDRIGHLTRATQRLSDTIAHELRTPLTRIRARLDTLPAPEADRAALASEIGAVIGVFDSLLEISRTEAAAGASPGLQLVDLSALAREMGELYRPAAEERRLAFEERIADGIEVLGDRGLLARLLANLLDNAVKFTPAGGTVTLALETIEGRHRLRVADDGPGLPPEMAGGGFERFLRGARDRDVPGNGLGLALCQAIATRHGARLGPDRSQTGLAMDVVFPPLPAG